MTKDEMKAIARRGLVAWEVGIRDLDMSLIDEIFAPDYVSHAWAEGTPPGTGRIKESVTNLHTLIGDPHYKVDDQLADGDKVVTRYRATGTHIGDYLGVPATGKYGEMKGITIDRIADGQIAETWYVVDAYGYKQFLESDESWEE